MTEEQATAATAPAGWYAHPTMAATQRYWDGEQWTENIAPMQSGLTVQPVEMAGNRMPGQRLSTKAVTLWVVVLTLFFFFFIAAGLSQ
jgi:hypothetical protein